MSYTIFLTTHSSLHESFCGHGSVAETFMKDFHLESSSVNRSASDVDLLILSLHNETVKTKTYVGEPPLKKETENKKRPERKNCGARRHLPLLLIWFFLLITSIPFFLIFAIHLPWIQKQIFIYASHQLKKNTDIELQLESLEWRPFSCFRLLRLEMQTSGELFLECERAELAYHFSWKWPYLHPSELSLQKPFLRLEKDEAGNWSIPKGKNPADSETNPSEKTTQEEAPKTPSFWVRFPWPQVRFSSAVIFAYQNGQPVLSVRNVTGTFSLYVVSGPKGPSLKIDLGHLQGNAESPQWEEWKLSGDDQIRKQAFFADRFIFTAVCLRRLKDIKSVGLGRSGTD